MVITSTSIRMPNARRCLIQALVASGRRFGRREGRRVFRMKRILRTNRQLDDAGKPAAGEDQISAKDSFIIFY